MMVRRLARRRAVFVGVAVAVRRVRATFAPLLFEPLMMGAG